MIEPNLCTSLFILNIKYFKSESNTSIRSQMLLYYICCLQVMYFKCKIQVWWKLVEEYRISSEHKVEMTILISDKGDFKIKNILDIK